MQDARIRLRAGSFILSAVHPRDGMTVPSDNSPRFPVCKEFRSSRTMSVSLFLSHQNLCYHYSTLKRTPDFLNFVNPTTFSRARCILVAKKLPQRVGSADFQLADRLNRLKLMRVPSAIDDGDAIRQDFCVVRDALGKSLWILSRATSIKTSVPT